jgi:hypothetical protein
MGGGRHCRDLGEHSRDELLACEPRGAVPVAEQDDDALTFPSTILLAKYSTQIVFWLIW